VTRAVHVETTYDQPPELVWAALTTSEAIAVWLMPNDFELRVGHRFQFKTKPAPGFDGIVPDGTGTRLTLAHEGFTGLRGFLVSSILGKGWRAKILRVNLPALLSRWSGSGPLPATPEADCHRKQ
jgi:hypothetical protein